MAYEVAFDVNGSIRSISGIETVKPGKSYLRCLSSTEDDEMELVALIPLDSVKYIAHDSLDVSPSPPPEQPAPPQPN